MLSLDAAAGNDVDRAMVAAASELFCENRCLAGRSTDPTFGSAGTIRLVHAAGPSVGALGPPLSLGLAPTAERGGTPDAVVASGTASGVAQVTGWVGVFQPDGRVFDGCGVAPARACGNSIARLRPAARTRSGRCARRPARACSSPRGSTGSSRRPKCAPPSPWARSRA